jgi:hypothetical protein
MMQLVDSSKSGGYWNNRVRTLKTPKSPPSSFGLAVPLGGAAVLMRVWTLAAIYLVFYLNRDWIASDDGAFAQSAERVLNGELPHRDFELLSSATNSAASTANETSSKFRSGHLDIFVRSNQCRDT